MNMLPDTFLFQTIESIWCLTTSVCDWLYLEQHAKLLLIKIWEKVWDMSFCFPTDLVIEILQPQTAKFGIISREY